MQPAQTKHLTIQSCTRWPGVTQGRVGAGHGQAGVAGEVVPPALAVVLVVLFPAAGAVEGGPGRRAGFGRPG
jgi:hypothetical protein